MDKTTSDLSAAIDTAFPLSDMPPLNELTVCNDADRGDQDRCPDCWNLQDSINEWRLGRYKSEPYEFPVLDVFCLSAAGIKWVLPFYLRQCLKNGSYYSDHTDRLLSHLSSSGEFKPNAIASLSLLDQTQIDCLKIFLDWCADDTEMNDFKQNEIVTARNFLSSVSR